MNILRRKIYAIEQQDVLPLRDGKKLPGKLHRRRYNDVRSRSTGSGTQAVHGKSRRFQE